jgi:glycosyltransferase involved in cell wall biosynthesis
VLAVHGDGDDGHRVLAPLHAPAEMCLAVAREVVDSVGAADEGFGLGPCWEMEYAARAARAGYAAVWVAAAYVHRAPPTSRRRRTEARSFGASKHRYQDRLCGLRLDGTRFHHVDHCAGDDCAHFAPADRIVVHLPLGTGPQGAEVLAPAAEARSRQDRAGRARAGGGPPPCMPAVATAVVVRAGGGAVAGVPFVSCVLPTFERPGWLARAIEYFRRQDHPAGARELIVVDDGDRDLAGEVEGLAGDPAITYVRLTSRMSIGAKRNLAIRRARGEVIAQWDDDDWYGPDRLSRQVAPIAGGTADITGLRGAVWFDVGRWRFRCPTAAHHRRLFVGDVSGGTLVFDRSLWDRGLRYPDTSLAEDAALLRAALRHGFRLARLPAEGAYLYVRHDTNSWQLRGRDERAGWEAVPEPSELLRVPDDRSFYAARSRAAPPPPSGSRRPAPGPWAAPESPSEARAKVSCIMPTADRLDFLPSAIAGFLDLRYDDAELVVVDDGDEPAGHLMPDDPRVRYIRLDRRHPLGAKRNVAVEAAVGEVIVHLDDDDWSHPDRLAVQVDTLSRGDAEVCGLARQLWWDPRRAAAWRYTCPPLRRPWVAGNTLAYWREAWRRSPFPAVHLGEDTAFVWADRCRGVLPLDDERIVVGTIHARNSSSKHTRARPWTRIDPAIVLRIFAEAGAGPCIPTGTRAKVQ